MLGEYELKTISNIIMLALWRNKLKPSLLSFHILKGFFLSLSLDFFNQVTVYIEKSERKTEPYLCLLWRSC